MSKRIVFLLAVLCLFFISTQAQSVYVLNAHSQLEPVNRAVTMGQRVSGNQFFVLYGSKLTSSLVLDGKTSKLVLPMGATYFYVYCPSPLPIESWKIAPLKKGKKSTRELPFAKSGAYSGTNTNIEDVEVSTEKISDAIYRLTPTKTLEKGEYALIRVDVGVPAECYDFRIDPTLSPALEMPDNDKVMALFRTATIQLADANANSADDPAIAGSRQMLSDVDINIPITNKVADNTFALIISNENYKRAENVPFAHNDGKVFSQYMKLCVGLPESHIIHIEDASLSDIKYALNRIKEISEAYEGDAKIIVYYSGHGIPNEKTQEGYLLPSDGYVSDPTTALKLNDLYTTLGDLNAKSLILFLDACFSGAKKDGGMLASARGVAIKTHQETPTGNLVVVSASQGEQTAFPYASKEHGMMTYFLLKKLQDSKGDANLGELSDYIISNVKKTSLVENGKSQIPTVTFDENNNGWNKQTLR